MNINEIVTGLEILANAAGYRGVDVKLEHEGGTGRHWKATVHGQSAAGATPLGALANLRKSFEQSIYNAAKRAEKEAEKAREALDTFKGEWVATAGESPQTGA